MLYNFIYIALIYTIPEQFITSGFLCNSAVANVKIEPSSIYFPTDIQNQASITNAILKS